MEPRIATMSDVKAPASDKISSTRRYHDYAFKRKKGVTKEEVLDLCKEHKIKYMNMQFVDILGMPKALTIPVHKLESALDNNVWFDGSSIKGFARVHESDMYLKPDLDTFAVLPWTTDREDVTGRIICDAYHPNGEPFMGDPRQVLKKQMEEAKKLGFVYNTGPELEFFLFKKEDGDLRGRVNDGDGYFDLADGQAVAVRNDMSFALDQMGVEVEALHHEVAKGCHEIDFKYSDALTTADNAVTLRMVLKAIAAKYDLHATFMAKPMTGIDGCGMHVHQSFSHIDTGVNAFYDAEAKNKYNLSKTALSFIAGQMKHIRGMNALINSTVNSYKRLVKGFEAPVYIAWARTNRTGLIRVPYISPSTASVATRIELRCPDPMSNPYLAFSAMLAAGIDGVKNGLEPPAPIEEDIYEFTPEKAKEMGVASVCPNLRVALSELKQNDVIMKALGEHAFQAFYNAKKDEWARYKITVSRWEIEEYFSRY